MTSFIEPVLTSESSFSPVALSITHWQGNTTPGCVQAVVSVSPWGCCCMKTHSMKPPAKSCVSFVKTHSQFLSCLWDTWIFILGFLFLSARCFTQFSVVQAWMKSRITCLHVSSYIQSQNLVWSYWFLFKMKLFIAVQLAIAWHVNVLNWKLYYSPKTVATIEHLGLYTLGPLTEVFFPSVSKLAGKLRL